MNGLLILLIVLNVAMLVAVTAFYRRSRRRQTQRIVEAPESEQRSRYVRDLESKERWEAMDRSLLHEVNREEFDRVLAKLRATSVRALTDGERAFLDRMLEAERRVRRSLRRDRRAEASVPPEGTGRNRGDKRRERGDGGPGGGAPQPAHRYLLILFLLATAAPAQATGQTLDGRFLDRAVDSIAAAHLEQGTVAGLTVGVMRDGVVLHHRGYGYADLEMAVRTPLDAVYQVGSVTKQFTAVLALQLVGEGRLDLDADLTRYLPDFDTGGRAVPVRRLLDHTSGMKGYTEMAAFGPLRVQHLPRDTLVRLVEGAPWNFEPGEALIYNNSGYFLLGLILEEVSGRPYEELLRERIFEPVGMERSHYCSNTRIVEDRARGYAASLETGMERAAYLDHLWPYAAGSVCSTARDLLTWNHRLHQGGFLDADLYDLMTTPEPLSSGVPIRYAKGLVRMRDEHGLVLVHGGGIDGFLSAARHYPEHDLTVVVLQNTAGPAGPGEVSSAVVDLLLPSEDTRLAAVEFPGDLEDLAGLYAGPVRGGRMQARVFVEDGVLKARTGPAGGPAPESDAQALRYVGQGRFTSGGSATDGIVWFVDDRGRAAGTEDAGAPVAVHFEPAPSAHYVLHRR